MDGKVGTCLQESDKGITVMLPFTLMSLALPGSTHKEKIPKGK